MTSSHQTMKLSDKVNIYAESHLAENATANLVFLHGYTEHTGRYTWMFQKMTACGINVFAYDQRGYGRSDGERAYVPAFKTYIEDLTGYLNQIQKPSLPTFIMGHSMGSLIAVLYLIQNPNSAFKGFISSAGALKIDEGISPFLRKVSGILSVLTPHLQTIKLDSNALSRDPEEVAKYNNDKLVYHGGAKARFGHEMLKAMNLVKQNYSKISLPVLLLHGTSDTLADPAGSEQMYQNIPSNDKTLRLFPGLYHELMREPEKEEVMEAITTWIKSRI